VSAGLADRIANDPAAGLPGEGMSDDWDRYGGSHDRAARGRAARGRAALGSSSGDDAGRDAGRHGYRDDSLRDDPFHDYRTESAGGHVRRDGEYRGWLSGRRSRSNLIGVAAAALAIIGLALLFNLRASGIAPSKSPSPRPTAVARGSVEPTSEAVATIHMAHLGPSVQLPFAAVVPGRDISPTAGGLVYLAGDSGVAAVNPATGEFAHVFGGAGFPSPLRKWLLDDGLWLSTWPSTGPYCGPDCWRAATTYRVDPVTGQITLKRAGTFLVGATSAGVVVATGDRIEWLDPASGVVIEGTLPWLAPGEPRVGCAAIWSYSQDAEHVLLSPIDPGTGAAAAPSQLSLAITSGPILVDGQCWMMSGSEGAAAPPAQMVWLNPDGSVFDSRQFDYAVVVMDASSGVGYGRRYQLPLQPPKGDPSGLFSAGGLVWLADGDQLMVFDIRTGATATN
jgi:hypothetical protein